MKMKLVYYRDVFIFIQPKTDQNLHPVWVEYIFLPADVRLVQFPRWIPLTCFHAVILIVLLSFQF